MIDGLGKISATQNTLQNENVQNENVQNKRALAIFKAIDEDKNNEISTAEAKAFGFTTLGDQSLTQQQFTDKYNSFLDNTSSVAAMLKPFEGIFNSGAEKPFMHDVELTREQQKELLSRLEMFSAYFSVLEKDEQEELKKIKSDMMCFNAFRKKSYIPRDYELKNFNFPESKDKKSIKDLLKNKYYRTVFSLENGIIKSLLWLRKNDKTGNVVFDETLKKYLKLFSISLPDYKYDQIDNFLKNDLEKLKISLRNGETNKISNAKLAKYIKFATVSELDFDGKIGGFRQGSVGDCWFLASLMCYSSTPEGEKNIHDRIKKNNDGSYTVIFNNPFEQTKKEVYTVTAEELSRYRNLLKGLNNEDKLFSSGDIDVRILEIAANKMLGKYLPTNNSQVEPDDDMPIEGGTSLKYSLVHKALGYTDNVECFFFDQNEKSEHYKKVSSQVSDIVLDSNGKAEKGNIKYFNYDTNLLLNLGFNEKEIICGCDKGKEYKTYKDEKDKKFMYDQHAYSFYKINDNNSAICNPNYISYPHSISNSISNGIYFDTIIYFPQTNLITVDKLNNKK